MTQMDPPASTPLQECLHSHSPAAQVVGAAGADLRSQKCKGTPGAWLHCPDGRSHARSSTSKLHPPKLEVPDEDACPRLRERPHKGAAGGSPSVCMWCCDDAGRSRRGSCTLGRVVASACWAVPRSESTTNQMHLSEPPDKSGHNQGVLQIGPRPTGALGRIAQERSPSWRHESASLRGRKMIGGPVALTRRGTGNATQ
ncbi:hypothetical protein NDU88_006016 [Pleurodeles waltl]|uniref:Uncharacterized protein n=1 Tax=Pleurodeles waltl TaxID=8319 RepID=A0AAV7QGW7_PLEWA|nr:hypothetical protein NDU88_006016 [Pleurodeles waltl]